MPLLTHRSSATVPGVAEFPHRSQREATSAPALDPTSCLCGARLPLQVRLGFKSRTRPVLESRWSCSERCLYARVSSFVKRGMPTQGNAREHRHRVPLGLLLLQSRRISQDQLRHALELSKGSQDRVGEVLVRECGLSEHTLADALAQQWGCASWNVRGVRDEATCFAPAAILERTGMLPVRILRDGQLGVAFANAPDSQAIFALQRIHNRPVDAGITTAAQFTEARSRLLQSHSVPVAEFQCATQAELVRVVVRGIQQSQPVESRWARVHNIFWLRMWLEPAALLGGIAQTEDVVDHIFHLPEGLFAGHEA